MVPLSVKLAVAPGITHASASIRASLQSALALSRRAAGWPQVQEKPGRAAPYLRLANSSGSRLVVILGSGAAGAATVQALRNEGYSGRTTMLSADELARYD
jgi:hypothetical protein